MVPLPKLLREAYGSVLWTTILVLDYLCWLRESRVQSNIEDRIQ